MLSEVRQFYGLVKEFRRAGYYETNHLRRLFMVEDGGGTLSIVLGVHPKLKNDLRRPTMEEIGYRTAVFSLDSIGGCQAEYIQWLLERKFPHTIVLNIPQNLAS